MNYVIRSFDARIDDINQDERSLVARINTDEVDRYRTVIDPKGGRFDNYRKNPVTLWEHGKDPRRGTDPIGRNVWLKPSGKEILAKTRFLKDDFAQQRYEWYRDGTLSGFSVNVLPDMYQCSTPTMDELRSRPELERCEMMYRSWDLAEYSGTSVPGNASCLSSERAAALLACVERGLWIPDEAAAELRNVSAVTQEIKTTPATNTDAHVEHGDGQWHVMVGGRRSLSFDHEATAQECLRLMTKPVAFEFEYQIHSLLGDIRRAGQDTASLALEYIDLYTRGRI